MGEVHVNVSGIYSWCTKFSNAVVPSCSQGQSSVLSLCDCSHVNCVLSDTTQMN